MKQNLRDPCVGEERSLAKGSRLLRNGCGSGCCKNKFLGGRGACISPRLELKKKEGNDRGESVRDKRNLTSKRFGWGPKNNRKRQNQNEGSIRPKA